MADLGYPRFFCTYRAYSPGDMNEGPGEADHTEDADFKQALQLLCAADNGDIKDLKIETVYEPSVDEEPATIIGVGDWILHDGRKYRINSVNRCHDCTASGTTHMSFSYYYTSPAGVQLNGVACEMEAKTLPKDD
jgi:hypothetical protein